MSRFYSVLFLLSFLFIIDITYGQFGTISIDAPRTSSFDLFTGGGAPWPIHITVAVTGAPPGTPLNCTLTFSKMTRFSSDNFTALPECQPASLDFTQFTDTIVCEGIENTNNDSSLQVFDLISGEGITDDLCSGESFVITGQCGFTGPVSRTYTASVSSSSINVTLEHDAVLGELVVGNNTNATEVYIVDATNATRYSLTYKAVNNGRCQASGVRCTLIVPTPLTTINTTGVVEYLRNESVVTGCQSLLDEGTFTCPTPSSAGATLPVSSSFSRQAIFRPTDNGELHSRVVCTANNNPSLDEISAEITAYVIGVEPPESDDADQITRTSDDSDDLIINTVIPLSIFGGLFIFLALVGGTTIGVFFFVKKVILKEENVGF